MYQDLWVATDGEITVRFSDQQSAEIYCAQTGWNVSDLYVIRQQVTVSSEGAITVEPWRPRMDPDVDTEVKGAWSSDGVWLPPLNSMSDGSTSIDDEAITWRSEYLKELGAISEQLNWGFRDLAASESGNLWKLVTYVRKCNAQGKKPSRKMAEKIIGRYAD
jgi:hypothetical protein